MKVNFRIKKHILQFNFTAGTSRGTFTEKPTWFIEANSPDYHNTGIGEASPLKGLSIDYHENYESDLRDLLDFIQTIISCDNIIIT